MKKLLLAAAGAVVLAGCMVTTVSKDYSADKVERSENLPFNKVENLDDIELFDKSAIPVVVKSNSKNEELYSAGGIHGLLWLCTLGIIPAWQTEAETHTMNVATPLGEKSGTCTVTKRKYLGWVPYMLPFGASEKDVLCEDELLSRLVSQYKKEWTAEKVEKMNVAKSKRIKELHAKADELLSQKKYEEVIRICNAEKNKKFVSKYMLMALKGAVDVAWSKKDYQRVVDLCWHARNNPELQSKRRSAIVNIIASSIDEAALSSLIKKYGKELSVSQIAEAGEKATNADVKAKISGWRESVIENADRKIEAEIGKFLEGKVEELRRRVEAEIKLRGSCGFSEYYHLSKKDERDVQFLAELLAKMNNPRLGINLINKYNPEDKCWPVLISGVREDALVALLGQDDLRRNIRLTVMDRITSPDVFFRLAVNEKEATWQYRGSSVGEHALAKINDKAMLVKIALLAVNNVVSSQAEEKVGDKKAIVDGMVELLSAKKISETAVERHVKSLNGEEATIALYNAAKGQTLKQLIFSKLSAADRSSIREGNVSKCKQLIDAAKVKGKDTFELGGFYLGMDIVDADMLIGYYFPDWSTEEGYDDNKKEVRVVRVPQQWSVFCRADKNGKVWQLNFGKKILKKFYSFDVQTPDEWARAFSRQHKIDMRYARIEKTIEATYGFEHVGSAFFHQETWQYKYNSKDYRLTYFGKRGTANFSGDMIRRELVNDAVQAQTRYISADEGTLRVSREED